MSEDQDIRNRAEQRIGTVVHGKYRLDAILGVGGMAVVFAATHRNQKKFALKLLHAELSLRADVRTRFLREGYVANAVGNEGVVAILDDDVDENGCAFLVMELLHGLDAQAWCARSGGSLPLQAALLVTHQLLEVLAVAHAKGVIHRDIKPANLLVQYSGLLKVLDFGIARLREHALGSEVTRTGAVLGTPAFMAPELACAQTEQIDARTDLWAVGATLFSLLSGQHVHAGEHGNQVLVRAATAEARSVLSVCPDLPLPVVELLTRALAFDKAARFQSAAEMASAVASAHQLLFGELRCDLLRSLVSAAAAQPAPAAPAKRPPGAAAGLTLSEAAVSELGATELARPLTSGRSVAFPSAARASAVRPRTPHSALLPAIAAALLCMALAFEWYARRTASAPEASAPAGARLEPVLLATETQSPVLSAQAVKFDASPPSTAQASAAAAPPRLSRALPTRRPAATRLREAHSEVAPPVLPAAKNPLDVELQ